MRLFFVFNIVKTKKGSDTLLTKKTPLNKDCMNSLALHFFQLICIDECTITHEYTRYKVNGWKNLHSK